MGWWAARTAWIGAVDRWTLLVMRNALVGMTRFEAFQSSLDVAPNVLTDRLARLTSEGILERRQYSERPPRHDYHPTEKGWALWPVLVAMIEFGDRYYAAGGAPRLVLHRDCGHRVAGALMCTHCQTPIAPEDIATAPGPGAPPVVTVGVGR